MYYRIEWYEPEAGRWIGIAGDVSEIMSSHGLRAPKRIASGKAKFWFTRQGWALMGPECLRALKLFVERNFPERPRESATLRSRRLARGMRKDGPALRSAVRILMAKESELDIVYRDALQVAGLRRYR